VAEDREDIHLNFSPPEWSEYDSYPQWLKDRLEWFQDMKFGFFMHWGIYSQWGCIESWPLVEDAPWARPDDLPAWKERGYNLARFRRDYWDLNRTFNPQHFEPEQWADLAARAGTKYVCFTTKHHDGFCMFDTQTTDYKVTGPDCPFHTNPRANVAREVFDAFRARDFAIWCYFSKSDDHCPYYWDPARPAPDRNPNYDTAAEPERWEQFRRFVYTQIEELMTGYGPIDCLWLDGGQVRPPQQDIRMDLIAEMARGHQPGLIIADRTVGGPYENIITPEQVVPEQPLGVPWESCLTVGDSWSFRPNDNYKSVRTLVHLLIDTVAKGGNLLLNVGPDADGVIPAEAAARLEGMGEWLAVNGEAIYGTRPIAPYKEGRLCFTRKGDSAYALILAQEGEPTPPKQIRLRGLRPALGTPVHLLGRKPALAWRPEGEEAVIDLPEGPPPCRHALALRFTPAL
jgi:alpha-L-fucosidase